MKDVSVVVAPPLSKGVFAYPHREGARLTLETLLGIMDGEDDPHKRIQYCSKGKEFHKQYENCLQGI